MWVRSMVRCTHTCSPWVVNCRPDNGPGSDTDCSHRDSVGAARLYRVKYICHYNYSSFKYHLTINILFIFQKLLNGKDNLFAKENNFTEFSEFSVVLLNSVTFL